MKPIKEIVFNKLKNLTSKSFNETSLILNIGIDSLDLVELVTEAEDELDIAITDEQLASIKTVGDVIKVFKESQK